MSVEIDQLKEKFIEKVEEAGGASGVLLEGAKWGVVLLAQLEFFKAIRNKL